jgi:radical SAM superfamily enzyme
MIEGAHRARDAGIRLSVIALLGLGGPELAQEHAVETGRVVSRMDPRYLSMLTLMLVPGTPLHEQWRRGTFTLMEPEAMLVELGEVIRHLDGLSGCVFRTNHASNYSPSQMTSDLC